MKRVKREKREEGGYVAVMTTIIMSLVLLSMLAQGGFAGWYARFAVLNRENKQQANVLAGGCAEMALASHMKNPALTSSTITTSLGTCDIRVLDASDPRAAEIAIQTRVGNAAAVGTAYTNMKIVADVYTGDILSQQETPND
ncbi:hypothetical protein C4568_02210 [Candidatus Parcubacteria bacterium]|nr:MAG: hypothetical protein C4568_02210 [Candidatus Parcubacteria bacterium]